MPRFHGVYHRRGGWAAGRGPLRERSDWLDYFARHAPDSLAIKPSKGVYARGLQLLERDGDRWRDARGDAVDIESMLDGLDGDAAYDAFILQDRLKNDPKLEELSGSQALQTARVVTLVDG